MKLNLIADNLQLTLLSCKDNLECEITCGCTSDILSEVIAKTHSNSIWITSVIHKNVIAVAYLKNIKAIILVGGITPDDEIINLAEFKNISIFKSKDDAFDLSGKIYKLLYG